MLMSPRSIAFVDPAMTDAINNLGGGGLSSPYIANLASALNYAGTCIMSLFGGPVINKIGIKYACMISAACYVLSGTGYYVMARYKNQPYLLTARVRFQLLATSYPV
jgi:MFS family permease